MKRNSLFRTLCIALCVTVLLSTFAILFSAESITLAEIAEEAEILDAEAPEAEAPAPSALEAAPADGEEEAFLQADESTNAFGKLFDWFFSTFGFIGFVYEPRQGYLYNQAPVFQWFLGFNNIYDIFPFVMNVYADTIKCHFEYEEKDWRIQLWKGGYGIFLATGGEIGIYTKAKNMPIEHYSSAGLNDWLNLTFTIYNKGSKLFTRPLGKYWWCTGYKPLAFCTDFLANPRRNVVMDTTIELKSAGMAEAFIKSLKDKQFTQLLPQVIDLCACGGYCEDGDCHCDCNGECKGVCDACGTRTTAPELSLSTPDSFILDGKTVRIIWQNKNEGWY